MKSSFITFFIFLISFTFFVSGCWEEQATPQITGQDRHINQPTITPTPPKYTFPSYPQPSIRRDLTGQTIVVDPGHGGKDPGALARWGGMDEKEIVIDIARKLADKLDARGAKVLMTRTNDRFIELDDRAALANRYNADLLISIHVDSHADSKIDGATVYISKNATFQSRKTAETIEDSFDSASIACRGIRSRDFRVLSAHSRPAVLVECGYITNYYDSQRLNNNWYRSKIAGVIADSVENSLH